jgi:hypothetical protein
VADTNNYSRAVEYSVDESRKEVSQIWEYGSNIPERLYTDKVGNAEQLPQTGNILITFGSVVYENGVPPSSSSPNSWIGRIKEVTHGTTPEVVYDLKVSQYDNPYVKGPCVVYRSHYIADLYAHPAVPVQDLSLHLSGSTALLTFSGDPARTYAVQASADLANWHWVGDASADTEPGTFFLQGAFFKQLAKRYYRVITE